LNSKTLCLAPWAHATVTVDTKLSPCCVSQTKSKSEYSDYKSWWHSQHMQDLRSDLANGVRNSNCNQCWQSEDLGKQSLRQGYNTLFKSYVDFAQIKASLKNKNFQEINYPTTWEIDIGNSCNLKCIMCDPRLSDKIQEEVLSNKLKFSQFPKLIQQSEGITHTNWVNSESGQNFLSDIKKNLKWIKIQGGEALSVKGVRDLIENLDSQEVTLSLTTNGTVLDQRLLTALSKFKRVEISISVEAIGQANDVIRYGSQWETIEKNINSLMSCQNVDLQLNHVLQNTSTIFLPNVIEFAEQQGLHLSVLPLYHPAYLSLSSIPSRHLDNLINVVEQMEIKNVRNKPIKQYLTNVRDRTVYNQDLHHQFCQYVSTLDQIRSKKLTPWLETILSVP
jgi:MoaA/NifB/PqqE/SkfB family radical SAM enzyme